MRLLKFVGRACVLLVLFVVPTAAFVNSSRMLEHPVKAWTMAPHPAADHLRQSGQHRLGDSRSQAHAS